ncbi:carbohydrate-binding protein [Streptomyces inhibens]|uniref:Carbohydrate-binding protein n=1 Tax=Streptomyces inhibens TaxID=2293571 RepID=A0A371PXG8_STRIH|nr:carbohydrate-binding protein [Streptomyces inhibens]REK87166.1 carbohydrate-binding protein [Streptomyces inhibens]
MTAGNNGADTPENDDPFAYLYRSEGGEGGAPGSAGDGAAARQPGVPRTSYNQVRAVGQRQYGQQAPQQITYGQQNAHYAAPEALHPEALNRAKAERSGALPGGDRTRPVAAPGHGGQEPRRRNGLLIGAVAVVAVVCIGIGVAMLTNGNDAKNTDAGKPGPTAGDSVAPNKSKPTTKPTPGELPKEDAGSLRLDGGATTAKDVQGARTSGGTYVAGMNTPGASVTWTVNVEAAGKYKFYVGYGVPGKDANLTLNVNGKADTRPVNMGNFAGAPDGAWDKGWTKTWSYVQLTKGTNTVKLSCETGNQCNVNLDKVWLAKG